MNANETAADLMASQNSLPLVFDDIFPNLVSSVMRAQLDLVRAWQPGLNIDDIPDQVINKHFSWLALLFTHAGGKNRHFSHPLTASVP